MYLTVTASKLLQRSIVRTTRRNREQKSICYYSLAYSNWNLWATDLIHSEDLLSSGENQLLSIKEAFFSQKDICVLSHQPHLHLFLWCSEGVFWGVKLTAAFLPGSQGWVDWNEELQHEKPAAPHAHLQTSLLQSMGLSETQRKHYIFP